MTYKKLVNEIEIPKVIHYCWFGGNPLPDIAIKCINSWKKNLPSYEIKEWNESNFDVNCCKYVQEAYNAKKWAFVSDFARFWILYNFGGLYFDTDVEMLKPIDDIMTTGPFMGMESKGVVAPGLGIAASCGLPLYKEILDDYINSNFYKFPGVQEDENVVGKTTRILKKHGFDVTLNTIQNVDGITIYPSEYFAPMNYFTKEINITENTRTIHLYAATWVNPEEVKINILKSKILKSNSKLRILTYRLRINRLKIQNRIKTLGLVGIIKYIIWKLKRKIKND